MSDSKESYWGDLRLKKNQTRKEGYQLTCGNGNCLLNVVLDSDRSITIPSFLFHYHLVKDVQKWQQKKFRVQDGGNKIFKIFFRDQSPSSPYEGGKGQGVGMKRGRGKGQGQGDLGGHVVFKGTVWDQPLETQDLLTQFSQG